jgi:hypothetical protein
LGPFPQLFNVIIEGTPPSLHQLTFPISSVPTEDFTADNIVEENDISINFAPNIRFRDPRHHGIHIPYTLRTIVRNNKIHRPSNGIYESIVLLDNLKLFPGKCTLDPNRYCLADDDCFIPGIDDISKGTCADTFEVPHAEWFASDMLIEDNEITGPSILGIGTSGKNAIIRGNRINGPTEEDSFLGGITLIGKFALEAGTVVTRNIVSNVPNGLWLRKAAELEASFFNAEIRLNDFTGYTTAVLTSKDYNLPSELSGNFWGLTCEEGGFDPKLVKKDNGGRNNNVVEMHPYGEPIANTPDEDLPPPCF